jgi:hypothetical protein
MVKKTIKAPIKSLFLLYMRVKLLKNEEFTISDRKCWIEE